MDEKYAKKLEEKVKKQEEEIKFLKKDNMEKDEKLFEQSMKLQEYDESNKSKYDALESQLRRMSE